MDKYTAPLYVVKGVKKPKNVYFNLNNYRNWNHFLSNDLKIQYKELLKEQLKRKKYIHPIKLTFILWKKSNRKIDRANPLSIHEKFFCDALQEYGCIPDDNDEYITQTTYKTGGLDRENPRVEIIIEYDRPDISSERELQTQIPFDR